MSGKTYILLCAVLFLTGAGSVSAVEHDEAAQKDGQWVFKNTEDPVFKYMRDTWITNERYFEVSSQTGKNWIEPADAILNRRKGHRMESLPQNGAAPSRLDRSGPGKPDQI